MSRGGVRLDPTLYLVTDTAQCGPRGVPDVVRAAVAGGVTAVQVRDKGASDRELLELVRSVQDVLRGTGVALLVDDAVDVALVAGADGVHVGQSDLPVEEVRRLVGPGFLLGLSTHTVEQVRAAAPGTVDYVGIGPVRDTTTKSDAAPQLGADGLAAVAAAARVPAVAIGGIHADNLPSLRPTGIAGFCVVSEICTAPDPAAAAQALRELWDVPAGVAR